MTLDLILLALVLIFAALGALTGAARQISSLVASVIAYVAARPIGAAYGPRVSESMHVPLLFGTLATTVVGFVVVLVVSRSLLNVILRRILLGRQRERALFDGFLGFILGGARIVILAYVMLSALAFVEDNVVIAGQRLGISPKDSQAFALAKSHNLFASTEFGSIKDLVRLTQAVQDPVRRAQLMQEPAFQSLMKDSRFRTALNVHGVDDSQDAGNYGLLLRNNAVFQLVRDGAASQKMATANEAIQGIPPTPPDGKFDPALATPLNSDPDAESKPHGTHHRRHAP
jgi:membrane protein required for colicin V production